MKNWQIKTLKQLYVPINNLSYSRDFLTETPQRLAYIHYGDIHTDKIPEVVSGKTTLAFLLDSISIPSEEKYLLKEGDIVLVDASEDYEGVGKNIEISAIQNKKIVAGLHTIALRPIDATNLTPEFGRYLLKHPLVSKRLKAIAQGTKVFSISFTLIQKLKVPLPPLEEQRKIVEVLETWDNAITLTKQLIEQKELQKKYLMQQLLTGHARLTGFTGKWKLLPLSEILKERKEYQTKNQELPHLSLTKEGVLPKTERYNRDFLVKDEDKLYKITHENDICYNPANLKFGVICRNQYGSGIFSPIYVTYEVTKYNSGFVGYLLTLPSSIAQARRFEEGTVYERMAVSSEDFLKVKLPFPTCEEESSQISIVIRKAEEEIYLLKQKLAKLEEQKKGLMQVLLTGKVRLK